MPTQTPQQQSNAYQAASGQLPNVNGNTPITSSLMAPTSSNNYSAPNYPQLYPTATLATQLPQMQQTAPEQKASDLSTRLQQINDQLTGKSAFQSDLYAKQGYTLTPDANGNLTPNDPTTLDLNSQLTQLTNEAQAIPQQLQNDATGRGVTAGGLQPEQTAALRNNSIKALTVSSLLAAKQNKLAYAKTLIDSAVQQKYGTLEAEQKAATQNLQLILNSPDYTVADKNRAQQQQQLIDRQKAQLDLEKSNYTNAQNEVLKYAPVANASQLQQLQQATNPAEVTQIAASLGLQTLETQQGQLNLQKTKADIASQAATLPLDIALKKAQTASQYADIGLKRAQAAAFANPNLINAIQNGMIDPTKVNSRNAPFMSALANAGVNVNQLGIDAAATKKVITNLSVQQSQLTQAGGALEKNIPLLAKLSDKVNTLGIPAADTNLNSWKTRYSNQPDIVNYLSVLQTVRSEYAKYISRGGQVDDAVNREAAAAIPVGINGASLNSLHDVIKQEGDNVQQSIKDAKNNQWQSLQGTSASNTQQQTTKSGQSFDYQGAKAAGYTDAQIQEYLNAN